LTEEHSDSHPKKTGKIGYSERKITQLRELKTIIWGLDLDEGLRFSVDYPGYKDGAYLFLTKCDDKYCTSIRERVLDTSANQFYPGGKEQWKYFETAETAWVFVSKFLKNPIEAYYY